MSETQGKKDSLLPKPLSSYARGAGLTRRRILGNIKWNVLRDNFEISTWLAMGATFQILLSSLPTILPIPYQYTFIPSLLFLTVKFIRTVLMCWKIVLNPRTQEVSHGTSVWSIPEGAVMEKGGGRKAEFSALPGNDDICVVMAGAQTTHPFGQLAPMYDFNTHTDSMVLNLEQNAATNGFLGATSWMNTSTYTSGNMQMILLYFRSKKDVRAFYTSKAHKIGSSWSTRTREEGRASDIGLYQENYVSGKGEWDNFGKECVPCMFDDTVFLVEDEDGNQRWEKVFAKKIEGPGFMKRRQLLKDAKEI